VAVSPRQLGVLLAGLTLAVDQAHKAWMIHVFDIEARPPIAVLPFLDITMAWNRGVSYSLLRADTLAGQLILAGFALLAIALMSVWLWRAAHPAATAGLGLIIGGAAGNAIDRLHYGAVADFFHFHTPVSLGPLSNYVFNLADVGIVAGVVLLLYESLLGKQEAAGSTPAP
jgi:signal peptidase II